MTRLAQYLEAAERDNTRQSYASAIRHFEIEWNGLLPSTADAIARYLADHAATLAINTLRQRLAALSRWQTDQDFADPTKSPLVRQVLKGIRSVHAAPEKRARPLELAVLKQIYHWLDAAIGTHIAPPVQLRDMNIHNTAKGCAAPAKALSDLALQGLSARCTVE